MDTMTPQERRRIDAEIKQRERIRTTTREALAALRERFPGRYPERPPERRAS